MLTTILSFDEREDHNIKPVLLFPIPFFEEEEEDIFRAQKKGREHTLVLGRM